MLQFASQEWVDELARVAAQSPVYGQVARGWAGTVHLVVFDDPGPATTVIMTGEDARWTEVRVSRLAAAPDATFTLIGPVAAWREVLQRRRSLLEAVLSGQLRVRGHLPDLLRWREAIVVLTELASQLPTRYPEPTQT